MSDNNSKRMREQDPLDPENDIFWIGPGGTRKEYITPQSSVLGGKPINPAPPPCVEEPYRLKPDDEISSPENTKGGPSSSSSNVPNLSTTLKRPAGPAKPGNSVCGGQQTGEIILPCNNQSWFDKIYVFRN